jgi:uncharacterized protein (TIGR02246 family)
MNAIQSIRVAGLPTLAALVFLVSACAPPPPAELTEADKSAITAAEETFQAAFNESNWDALAALYTEDAVVMPPNGATVTGRQGIKALFSSFPPGTVVELKIVDIQGVGDLAYVRGTTALTIPMGDVTATDLGKYVEIRRKQADGSWLMTVDIFNSDTPLPAPEM